MYSPSGDNSAQVTAKYYNNQYRYSEVLQIKSKNVKGHSVNPFSNKN
jgi:hypothetical protein